MVTFDPSWVSTAGWRWVEVHRATRQTAIVPTRQGRLPSARAGTNTRDEKGIWDLRAAEMDSNNIVSLSGKSCALLVDRRGIRDVKTLLDSNSAKQGIRVEARNPDLL